MQIPNYAIKEIIGQGGMATVYRSEHVLLKQERAIKVMSPELSREPGFQESFIREGQIVAGLRHPHIITVYDVGVCEEGYFMVMEYLRGASLKDRLKQQGALPMQEALSVLQQIGSALHYAHSQGLIHRDIKPANILFRESGEAVLTDFGISKQQDQQSDLTRYGYAMMGTPRYMSPEQMSGEKLDFSSDIYSLALVLYEMLIGQPAIQGDSATAIIQAHMLAPPPQLPLAYTYLQAVLNKALDKRPEYRYTSAQEFIGAIALSGKLRTQNTQDEKTVIFPHSSKIRTQAVSHGKGLKWLKYILLLIMMGGGATSVWWLTKNQPGWLQTSGFRQIPLAQSRVVAPATEAIPSVQQNPPPPAKEVTLLTQDAAQVVPQVPSLIPDVPPPKKEITPSTQDTTPIATAAPLAKEVALPAQGTSILSNGSFTLLTKTRLTKQNPYTYLYQLPDTSSRVLIKLYPGTEVETIGSSITKSGQLWMKAGINGKQGFVKEGHLIGLDENVQ